MSSNKFKTLNIRIYRFLSWHSFVSGYGVISYSISSMADGTFAYLQIWTNRYRLGLRLNKNLNECYKTYFERVKNETRHTY